MNLIDIYKTFNPKAVDYTFLSSTHDTFFRIDHMLGYKKVSVNSRRLKSHQAPFLTTMDETRNQLQEENWKKTPPNMEIKNLLLNNQWFIKEIKGKIKYLETN